jgi:hypothetical protein
LLKREGCQEDARDIVPLVFVLSDQNFPAALPVAEGEGECINIFRIEDASPLELANGFLEATRGFSV